MGEFHVLDVVFYFVISWIIGKTSKDHEEVGSLFWILFTILWIIFFVIGNVNVIDALRYIFNLNYKL